MCLPQTEGAKDWVTGRWRVMKRIGTGYSVQGWLVENGFRGQHWDDIKGWTMGNVVGQIKADLFQEAGPGGMGLQQGHI